MEFYFDTITVMPDFELNDLEKNERKVKAENQELKKELQLGRNLFVKHLKHQGETVTSKNVVIL